MRRPFLFSCALFLSLLMAIPLSARPRVLDMRKKSSSFTNKKLTTDTVKFKQNTTMSNQRFDIQEWHKQYSSIGNRKANVKVSNEGNEKKLKSFEKWHKKDAKIDLNPKERKMANVKNWNQLREVVKASKYSGEAITSPTGRRFNDMVDEITLAEINRFQTVRNDAQSKEGIPVQSVSGSESETPSSPNASKAE